MSITLPVREGRVSGVRVLCVRHTAVGEERAQRVECSVPEGDRAVDLVSVDLQDSDQPLEKRFVLLRPKIAFVL